MLVSPDEKHLITAKSQDFGIWQFPSGVEILRKTHNGLNFKFSPNERYFATDYQKEKSIHVWETISGTEVGTITYAPQTDNGYSVFMPSAVSPNGKYVLTESDKRVGQPRTTKGDLLLWDVTSGSVLHRLPHPDFGYVAEFSPDGSKLATTGENVLIWDIPSGELARTIIPNAKVEFAAFSPSGKYFVTAGKESKPQVWEVSTGSEQRQLESDDARSPLIFSPDERFLAYTMKDGSGRILQVLNKHELRFLHPGGVEAVAFSPDSHYLVTRELSPSSEDEQPVTPHTDIWSVDTGLEVTHLDAQYGHFQVFSPDGRFLVTESYVDPERLGLVWILPWRRDDLVNEACSRLTRNLTIDEWNSYLPDEPYRKTCPHLP
jgi:WD40 repeat protein